MNFLREVFSEDGEGSASRVMMLFHFFAGTAWVSFHLWKGDGAGHHPIPDLGGVTTFVIAPYAINKAHAGIASVADALRRTPSS